MLQCGRHAAALLKIKGFLEQSTRQPESSLPAHAERGSVCLASTCHSRRQEEIARSRI